MSLPSCCLALCAWGQPALEFGPGVRVTAAEITDWKARSRKVSGELLALADEYLAFVAAGRLGAFTSADHGLRIVAERVIVDAVAAGDAGELERVLNGLGMNQSARFGRMVSGRLPISAIPALAAMPELKFVRAAMMTTRVGLVTSQGDAAIVADDARSNFGIDGTGVTVGTLSDSYDCLGGAATDVTNGDLPMGVTVLDDTACAATDEGRAMMQLIADVAPGTAQAFHTAFGGQADFALGITELQSVANSDVIVDDVIYFAEPMFADGVVAQAVDSVVGLGVAYFSSAGNNARLAYDSAFAPSGMFPIMGGGEAHDFDPGAGTDIFQQITIAGDETITISFQWDQPYFSVSGAPGSANDIDIYLIDDPPTTVLTAGATNNLGGDPIEVLQFTNPNGVDTTFNLAILNFSGANPGLMKYAGFGSFTIDEFDTMSGTVYGHANAAGAEAVGAVAYFNTPDFGVTPPLLNSFSSGGRTPILFDSSGNPVNVSRQKPEISCADGGNTTFFGSDIEPDGFPNFFGTSAAAPHAAGIGALLLEVDSSLTPAEINSAIESTAIDMGTSGVDDDSGAGLCQADPAVDSVIAATVTKSPSPASVDEPGANVTFAVQVTNDVDIAINLTSLTDDVHGDLNGQGTCAVPQTIAAAGNYQCSFTVMVSGNAGESETDTVTAGGTAGISGTFSAMDSATVPVNDVAPTISVTKTADPTSVDEPGASVDFTVRVDNTGSAESVDLTALSDDVHGNLNGQGDCSVPQTIAAGGFYECTFSATVSGNAGDSETDTVTATAEDDDGNNVMANDSATVTVNDSLPEINVTKTPSQFSVDEPGGNVTFTVRLTNTGNREPVTLTALSDDVHGDLNGQGSCSVPQAIPGGGPPPAPFTLYACTFTAVVSGNAGDIETNTVTATAEDDEANSVMSMDSASVTVNDVLPTITVTKTASPTLVGEPGGNVNFTVRVDNTGSAESVALSALSDDIHGNLDGQGTCTLPQAIAAAGFYECTFSATVSGNAGDFETDTVTATAGDDDGNNVMAMDSATVNVVAASDDFGDAPTPYPTRLADNGARHGLGSGIILGAQADGEPDGQPDANALGDDLSGSDDEDGVSFGALAAGASATIDVTAALACLLNAWVDFNADGDWDDAVEQIFADEPLAAGVNNLVFNVPAAAAAGDTFARLRCDSGGGLAPTGAAVDGEVEDHQVTIADTTPPIVTNVISGAVPGNGVIAECQEVRLTPTELVLEFSEPMTDPPGDTDPGDVSNPAQYELLASGPDQDFETLICSAVLGDDRAVSITAATYNALSNEVTLVLAGIGGLTEAFRLSVCAATPLTDTAGNPLDGDGNGSGGDPFIRGFRVETGNVFVNGQFDCVLDPWSLVSTDPAEIVHDPEDAAASTISGSMLFTNQTASSDFSASQCVEVQPGAEYATVFGYRVDNLAGAPLNLVTACEFFANGDCTGASLGSATNMFSSGNTAAQFLIRQAPLIQAPVGALSALCELDAESPDAGSFELRFDRVFLDRIRFRDGFEGP